MALRMGWVVLDTPVGHVVLADPEGNDFCILDARAGD
jgi:hypothetical protein